MSMLEFSAKAKEVTEYINNFCEKGALLYPDDEDYFNALATIAVALTDLAEASDDFADVAEAFAGEELKEKPIFKITPNGHLS